MEAGFKERMQARSILYSFFSRAYREEADTKFIEELRSVCAPDDELLGPFAEALHADDIEKLRLDLAADSRAAFWVCTPILYLLSNRCG